MPALHNSTGGPGMVEMPQLPQLPASPVYALRVTSTLADVSPAAPAAPADEPGRLHGWPVLERHDATGSVAADEILAALTRSDTYGDEPMRCFTPGLAFTLGAGPQ